MKKSMKRNMLMSTIAMIVVVVMAISTATFAWFSAFSTVDATLNFTVEAGEAGFQMRSRAVVPETNVLGSTWGDWTNTVAMTEPDVDGNGTGSAVKYTLSAPQTDITAPTYAAGADILNAVPENDKTLFYTAMAPTGTELYVDKVETAGAIHYAAYTEIQVQSASTVAQDMVCTATVATAEGQTGDAKSLEALKRTKIVIVAIKGDKGTPVYIGEQFNYGFYDATTVAAATVTLNGASKAKTTAKDFFDEAEVGNKITPGSANKFLKTQCGGRLTETMKTTIPNQIKAAATDTAAKEFKYTFTALTTAKTDYITLRIYSWIDGHTGDTQLKGGQVAVKVVFSKPAGI